MNGLHKLRNDTPGCHQRIHFNNAGASLPPKPVIQTQLRYILEESLTGGYELANEHKDDLNRVYQQIASLIGAEAQEIAIMENATQAWHLAFHALSFKPGDRIITTEIEYASNFISYLQKQKETDIEIIVIKTDEQGDLDLHQLEMEAKKGAALISMSHIPTNSGTVIPAEEIGRIANDYNIIYLLDACQSVGHYPVDVQEIGCDLLSATGRKYLRAPRGTGFLYVNQKTMSDLHPPFIDLHGAEWVAEDHYKLRPEAIRFENFETNMALKLALGEAATYANDIGIKAIWNRIQHLADTLRNQLNQLDSITVHDRGSTQCGIVTFTHEAYTATQIQQMLSKKQINVSVTSRQSALLDMERKQLNQVVRASVHYYNTEGELSVMINALNKL